MFKILLTIIILSTVFTFSQDNPSNDYDSLLHSYVKNGWVDYQKLRKDNRLKNYIDFLSGYNPALLKTRNDSIAFWINVYNAYTLKIVCDNFPVKSINELNWGGRVISHILGKTIWDKDLVTVNNRKLTLNEVENDILRKKFHEPRIHFAIVCAARSCPPLRNGIYNGKDLNEQLNDQAGKFLTDTTKNKIDLQDGILYLSKIFDWYSEDFGKNDEDLVSYISKFFPIDISSKLCRQENKLKIKYLDYDWSLNYAVE